MIKIVKNTPLLSKESLIETHFFNATITTVKEARFLGFSTMIFKGVIPEICACLKIFYKGPTERGLVFKTHDSITETISDIGETRKQAFDEAVILAVDKAEKAGIISYIMVSNSCSAVFRKYNKNYPVK